MIELFSSGLMSLWIEMAGVKPQPLNHHQLLVWRGVPLVVLPTGSEPGVDATMQQYLKGLAAKKMLPDHQGVWIQSGPELVVNHQGTVPVPAASLTKIATTLAALQKWGPAHQFETLIGATGPIKNGVLYGDLVITGSGDPFLIWEEAIALGNSLNQLGIQKVTGNLVIVGDFYMNYQSNPLVAGQKLKLALDSKQWPRAAVYQHQRMPKGTPKPQVAIAGGVKVWGIDSQSNINSLLPKGISPVPKQILLLRHQSVPLTQILKEMNVFSNNEMSEMLAKSVGGAQVVAQQAALAAGIPPAEIQLVNGSGLGVQNRISPRAAAMILMAVQRYLQPHNLNIADLFPVSGRDRRGTMLTRHIPAGTIIKTGTLNQVSALAGVMPTRDRGLVWFAIINGGNDVQGFRQQQDQLLQTLLKRWGIATAPIVVTPSHQVAEASRLLGSASRNQIVSGIQANLPPKN